MNKKIGNLLFYFGLVILMFFVIKKMLGDGIYEVLGLLKTIEFKYIALILVCVGAYNFMEGIIVWLTAKNTAEGLELKSGILSGYYTAVFRALTFGTGSAAALIYYLNKKNISPEVGYGIVTVSYSFHKITVALYVTVGLLINFGFFRENYGEYFGYIIAGYILTVIIVAILLGICLSSKFHNIILKTSGRILKNTKFSGKLQLIEKKLNSLRNETGSILRDRKNALKMIAAEFLKLTCWYLIPYISLKGMGCPEDVTVIYSLGIISLVVALVGVIPTPGNVASVEIIFTIMFSVLVSETQAAAAMIIYRFSTYYGAFFVAVIIYFAATRLVNPFKRHGHA